MDNDERFKENLSVGSKIAAMYLIASGILDLVWPLLNIPKNPELIAMSFAYKMGSYFRQYLLAILFIISGIGVLLRKTWARKLGLIIIPIAAFYFAGSVAWGIAWGAGGGKPSLAIYGVAAGISCVWNGVVFFLLIGRLRYKRTERQETEVKGNRG
jgi:hypothetical protein